MPRWRPPVQVARGIEFLQESCRPVRQIWDLRISGQMAGVYASSSLSQDASSEAFRLGYKENRENFHFNEFPIMIEPWVGWKDWPKLYFRRVQNEPRYDPPQHWNGVSPCKGSQKRHVPSLPLSAHLDGAAAAMRIEESCALIIG